MVGVEYGNGKVGVT